MAGETSLDRIRAEEVTEDIVRLEGNELGIRWGCELSRSIQMLVAMGVLSVLALGATPSPIPRDEPTVDALKARISSANVGDKPRLCVQVAEMRLTEADKLYAAGDLENAKSALTDVVAYSELARDYSIQSHKYQKQSEIAVRGMTRKLTNILHRLGLADQAAVKDAMNRLDRVRDDLLASMFKKGRR